MNWFVIYTKPRFEKVVSEKLQLAGIETYCPLLKIRKKWTDRWKWVEEPLLRSYCFVRLEECDKDKVFKVYGVVRYLYHCSKPAIVREGEIELLKNWLSEFTHESIEISGYRAQDKVLLKSGPLMDQKAEVVTNGGHYLILSLETLGMQIKVDLRKNIVEKIAS